MAAGLRLCGLLRVAGLRAARVYGPFALCGARSASAGVAPALGWHVLLSERPVWQPLLYQCQSSGHSRASQAARWLFGERPGLCAVPIRRLGRGQGPGASGSW